MHLIIFEVISNTGAFYVDKDRRKGLEYIPGTEVLEYVMQTHESKEGRVYNIYLITLDDMSFPKTRKQASASPSYIFTSRAKSCDMMSPAITVLVYLVRVSPSAAFR